MANLAEIVNGMPSKELDKLEEEIAARPYNDPNLTRLVLERKIESQSRCLADNLFHYYIKKCGTAPEALLVEYYKNRNGIKDLLPINIGNVYNFAASFKPQKKFWRYKILGKRYYNIEDAHLRMNKLLEEFNSEKRLLLWHNKFMLKEFSSQLIFGNCKMEEMYKTKVYDFSTEDVRSPFSLTQSLGIANYNEVALRRESSLMEERQFLLAFMAGKANVIGKAMLSLYLIDSPLGLAKGKIELMHKEKFESILYHELGHKAVFSEVPVKKVMKMPPYAREVLANTMYEGEYGIGLLPWIIKTSKIDEEKAIRLFGVHYHRNLVLYINERLKDEAIIELAMMSEALSDGGIDFCKLEESVNCTREAMLKDPEKVLKQAGPMARKIAYKDLINNCRFFRKI